jgi:hypothetical protein
VQARERIRLDTGEPGKRARHAAAISIELNDGRTLAAEHNVALPAKDLQAQEEKLVAKFRALAEPVIGPERTRSAEGMLLELGELPSIARLMSVVA